MSRRGVLIAACLLALGFGTVRADIVIDIEPVTGTLSQGGTTQANVFIYSNTPGGDTLAAYDYYFQLSRTSGDGEVVFKDQARYGNLFTTGNYVFQDGVTNYSNYATNSTAFVGEVTSTAIDYAGGTYDSRGGDFAALSPFFVTVPYYDGVVNTTKKLLTILTFTTAGGSLLPSVGSTFDVTLVADYPPLGYSSSFSDMNYTPLNFTSTPATLTVTSPPSVPEPGTLALVGLGFLGVVGHRLRRRA